jgi:hemin uptake protein HemP
MQTSTSLKQPTTAASLNNDCALAMPSPATPTPPAARKRLSSHSLLGSEREVEIEHGEQLYRLRVTALGKLILTK